VAAFHRRPLKNQYTALMLGGVLRALRRPVLVVLGIRPDGKKEIIDFHLAASESAAEWERFLTDLYRRGLSGEGLDMICVDGGGAGLSAALPIVLPAIPVQRRWAHKIRNILDKIKKADQPAAKRAIHKVMNAPNVPAARAAAWRFADHRKHRYPPSPDCATTSMNSSSAFATKRPIDARQYEQPTPSNAASARSDDAHAPWAPSRIKPHRILFAVFSHKKNQRASLLFSCLYRVDPCCPDIFRHTRMDPSTLRWL
jgi:transposase-like protein